MKETCEVLEEGGVICAKTTNRSKVAIVVVGGLGDGLFTIPYVQPLMQFGYAHNLVVITAKFRSMPHYGLYTIEDDVSDLERVNRLCDTSSFEKVFMIGHSTGCQVLMEYIQRQANSKETIILQGPVSDREYEESTNPMLHAQLEAAKASKGVLPFTHNHQPITAERFLDLFQRGGREDWVSIGGCTRGLNPHEREMYSVISRKDEYLRVEPETLRTHLESITGMKKVFIVDGRHSLEGAEEVFLDVLLSLGVAGPSRKDKEQGGGKR
ncbi:hypothetical protein NEDG_00757 [Nematocida displodere]|uniref:Dolichol-phosphate mannosyltransferase n=1 Tax=Nematocida displodere TaxID=1805483 RepID=A0A177ECE7_9MICR|nr:hypothetical protein NEDG_00757 [Nematocida displodere]